jgi:S1-C subfamily serine protease
VPSLPLSTSDVALNSTVAVLGYPGGNYRAVPGMIRDTLAVNARSIYNQGAIGRGVYVIQTSIAPGSSGGPAVLADGQVAGVVFSESTDVLNIAYALNSVVVLPAVHKSESSYVRVSTGACMG